jgi:cation:H+ antiporter
MMALFIATLVIGLAALAIGADRFVAGAASLASTLRISPLVIGLTVVSLGTSLPELLVTATAVVVGHSSIGLGNVLGSNISNICLVLGICALLQPLMVESKLFRLEYPTLLVATVATWLISLNRVISRLRYLSRPRNSPRERGHKESTCSNQLQDSSTDGAQGFG